jgi:phosphopantetheinyl transferase (holo-ACP synthase)
MPNILSTKASAESLASTAKLTLLWSCKEAVFKWYGAGEVDFKVHMQVQGIQTMDNKLFQNTILFKKEEDRLLDLKSQFFGDLCLSYIVT